MQQIPLTKGHVAVVDDDDYPIVAQFKWCFDNGYAARKITLASKQYQKVLLHRFLINAQPGVMVDHADGNPLNNTRANLRICNGTLNNANRRVRKVRQAATSSQYRGVFKELRRNSWRASIGLNNHRIHLGNFPSEEAAARAYDAKAIELYGEFAVLNFPVLSPVGDKGRLTRVELATS